MLKILILEKLSSQGKTQQAGVEFQALKLILTGQGKGHNTQGNYFCWNKLPKDIFSFEQARYPWEGCASWNTGDTAEHCESRDFVQYST